MRAGGHHAARGSMGLYRWSAQFWADLADASFHCSILSSRKKIKSLLFSHKKEDFTGKIIGVLDF